MKGAFIVLCTIVIIVLCYMSIRMSRKEEKERAITTSISIYELEKKINQVNQSKKELSKALNKDVQFIYEHDNNTYYFADEDNTHYKVIHNRGKLIEYMKMKS